MVHGVRLEDLVLGKVAPRVADSRLDHFHAGTGTVADGLVAGAPERQENVAGLFPCNDFANRVAVERLVRVVVRIKLEQLRSEIVVPVRTIVSLTAQDGDVLGTLNVRILVTVVNDRVSSQGHHRTKLEHLLSKGARDIILRRHGVLHSEGVESHN